MLQSSVSGLQRLFSTASSSLSPHTQRGQRRLESVTEEAHTYDLLYPESDALLQAQHHAYPFRHGDPAFIAAAASSTDDRGGLDIQSPRDVRIVVAQDATTRSPQPRVLYDSHPPISVFQARNGSSPDSQQHARQRSESFTGGLTGGGMRRTVGERKPRTAPHTRQSSLSQPTNSVLTSSSPLYPVSELGGLLGNSKGRNASARPATSDGETVQGRLAREGREETEALLECMFGAATGFPSTSSTKLHIRPPNSTDNTEENRPNSATRESMPSPAFHKRRTTLTRSTTAADLQALCIDPSQQTSRQNSPAIWITRLFSVDPKETVVANRISEDGSPVAHRQTHQDIPIGGSSDSPVKKEKVKQLKTPMYAVAILLQMPAQRQRPLTPSMPRSSGYTANSPRSWSFDGSPTFDLPGSDNGVIEYVIAHWNVIDRALSSLEVVARCRISDALGRLEVPHLAAPVSQPVTPLQPGSGIIPKKKKQPTQWTLQLPAGALQESSTIHDTVIAMGKRIALALRTRKVIVGQERWGIWREEARWVDKWAGGREQNFFFFNLLTAFVGSHTEWLDSLAPKGYRRRHARLPEKGRKDSNAIRRRTVIVCRDKMAGRRLIFLLSAFLPNANTALFPEGRSHSDAAWSIPLKSHSPPYGMPISREKSLRRTISRKSRVDPEGDRLASYARTASVSGWDVTSSEGMPTGSQGQGVGQQSRRASDARSVQSAALLISSDGSVTRKSSTTTTATVKPEASVPVAHFVAHSSDLLLDTTTGPRPASSESLAPFSLQRTLSRSESNGHGTASTDSQSRSGWGSLVSFWSGRRGSSTEGSDPLASSEEGLGISGVPKTMHKRTSAPKLSQMVDEVANGKIQRVAKDAALEARSQLRETSGRNRPLGEGSSAKQISKAASPEQFPLKLSIDENDGIIDVDLPPVNSYSSSFGSITSSPARAYTAASSLNDHPSSYNRTPNPTTQTSSTEVAGDVAGWLRNYHQDFALQAVRPYQSLMTDIKHSMRTEPTADLPTEESDAGVWTDVCSTIVADTTKYTITRLCLRRKNAGSPHHRANALLESPNRNVSHEEQITEEPLMEMDPTFIDAVEKVLSLSGDSSRVASRNPSRAPSPTRHHHDRNPTEGGNAGLEIPRSRCRSMVLGALEQVARSVGDELAAARDQSGRDVLGSDSSTRSNVPTESTLREGVRRWFREVDGQVT